MSLHQVDVSAAPEQEAITLLISVAATRGIPPDARYESSRLRAVS